MPSSISFTWRGDLSDDEMVDVGTELVRQAALEATAAGCEWLHVDFGSDLSRFYLDACGFRSTEAGLIHLPSIP